jgi:hypothetical protein
MKDIGSLGEIIAERPPQPLTSELSGRLGDIIKERTAGLPPEQRIDVAQRTIIEILLTTPCSTPPRPEVPLTGLLRRHVGLELARLWIDPKELKEIYRQRQLTHIETLYFLAQQSRKTRAWARAGKPQPQSTALEAVADYVGKEPETLRQSLKRGRRARKKPQP